MVTTLLLILHGLAAVLLLGALTHQIIGAWWRIRPQAPTFMTKLRAVQTRTYTNAVVVLYLATWLLGMLIYPAYNLGIRQEFKMDIPQAFGIFEIKEHFAAIGAALLPAYWSVWQDGEAQMNSLRKIFATVLAVIVWYDFLAGHVLNNLGGL